MARPARPSRTVADDEGSTLPLVAGLLALCLAVVVVATATTSLVLTRIRLLSLADGAALAAAESFALDDIRLDGGTLTATLRQETVEAAAAAHVAAAAPDGLDGIRVVAATTPDGRSATVTVSAAWTPPLALDLIASALTLEATSTARVVIR